MHELVATGNDRAAAKEVAEKLGGVCYLSDPNEQRTLPFHTLVRCVTDTPSELQPAATIGLYLGFSRVIRERTVSSQPGDISPGITAIFPLLRNQRLTHEQADAHWRDVHAPLALRHHPGMWDYTQLSVTQTLRGQEIDGFALVSFESLDSMKEKFFGDEHDKQVIYDDVASFADPSSPRRVVSTETIFKSRPPSPVVNWPTG